MDLPQTQNGKEVHVSLGERMVENLVMFLLRKRYSTFKYISHLVGDSLNNQDLRMLTIAIGILRFLLSKHHEQYFSSIKLPLSISKTFQFTLDPSVAK